MTKTIETDALFRPLRSKAESKAQTTDSASRAIVEAEASKREAKTAKLRQARLEMEAAAAVAAAPEKKAPRAKAKQPSAKA